jgi:hypothetical protein
MKKLTVSRNSRKPAASVRASMSTFTKVSRMAQTGKTQPPARINGQIIIDQLVRNMQLGQLEMGYSVLVPCIFSVYLHQRDLVKEDARRAWSDARPPLFQTRQDLLGTD